MNNEFFSILQERPSPSPASLPERSAGQANALDRISRNIARYAETQALGAPPVVTPEPTPSSATSAVIAASEATSAPLEVSDASVTSV